MIFFLVGKAPSHSTALSKYVGSRPLGTLFAAGRLLQVDYKGIWQEEDPQAIFLSLIHI